MNLNNYTRLPGNQQMVTSLPIGKLNKAANDANAAVKSVVAGSNITVNNTDPHNPIVSATSSGTVTSIATAGLISGGTITNSGTITTSMATGKLVGRGTSGTGVMEEITLGTNLSLSGTTLNATGGGGTPGGSNTNVQFNDSGAFGGDSGFTYDKTTKKITVTKTSLGTTTTDAILAQNTTSATSGNQQVSPAITRTGQGWKTDSGGASQSVAVRDYVLPVQSSANPTVILKNQFSINGGTWTDAFWYDQTPGGVGFSIYTSNAQSNGIPGTTRIMSLNNTGSNTWIDNNFSGTRKSSWGADSSGVMFADATGSNGLVVRVGGIAYHYLSNLGLLTTGYGAFQYGVNAGSTLANTSTLQSAGGTALKVTRVTVDTTLDNTYTKIIADATGNSSCTGTPTYACSHWANQTDCELRNSHGGCTWFAGNPCSAFDNEFNMGTCIGTSGCSATTNSCVGPTDETTCLAQDDTYGGSCVFNPESTGDCSVFNGSESTCSGTTGCSVSSSNSCPSQFDEGSCTGAGCSWNGSSCDGDNSTCAGTYVISPANCSGIYYTGGCTGTYGSGCTGTSSCGGISGSSNCGGETGCSWVTKINLYLPDLTTCPDRDYWIINGASGSEDVIIHPYSGQTIDMTTSYTIANYKDAIHISPYDDTRSCSSLAETPCTTTTGCTANYTTCAWDSGTSVCTGGGVCSGIFDETTCNATTYFSSCTGTYVVSKNWYLFSRS